VPAVWLRRNIVMVRRCITGALDPRPGGACALVQASHAAGPRASASLPGFFDEVATTSLCGDRQLEIRLTPVDARLEGP
jgi:hypothetical protein